MQNRQEKLEHNGLVLMIVVSQTDLAQFIAATRGRKVDCLACRDQTCCAISSILRRYAGRQRLVQTLRTQYPQSLTGTCTVRGRCLCQHQAETGLDGWDGEQRRTLDYTS